MIRQGPPQWNWPVGLVLILAVAALTFVVCEYFLGDWKWNG